MKPNGMTTKVKLPREVAEAIEHLRTITYSNHGLIRTVEHSRNVNPVTRKVYDWAFITGAGSPDLLMQALVIGYEVEQSPEESLCEYYTDLKRRRIAKRYSDGCCSYVAATARIEVVEKTLAVLGIEIGGINA